MTSRRRGERRVPGAGAGTGTGSAAGAGSDRDGEAAARGDEFADALALANESHDLAATYGDAFTLADVPPPAAPTPSARPDARRTAARTDEFGDALALTEPDGTADGPEPPPARRGAERRGAGSRGGADRTAGRGVADRDSGRGGVGPGAAGGDVAARGAGTGSARGPRRRGGEPAGGDGPAVPGARAASRRRAERGGADRAAPREERTAGSAVGGDDSGARAARTGSGRRPEGRGAGSPDGAGAGAVASGSGRGSRGRRAGPIAGGDGLVGPGARESSERRSEGRGAASPDGAGARETRTGSGRGPRAGAGESAAGGGPGEPLARTGSRRRPEQRGGTPGAPGGSARGGDPLDVALGLDVPDGVPRSARDEPHDPRGLSWDTARRVAVRSGRRLPGVVVPAAGAYGHVLADPLTALVDLPPFDTSAMDGYAVAGPGPWRLDSAGQGILAGHAAHPPLPDGHAVRIATGARVPPGATGVLRTEHAELRDDGTLLATAAPAAPAATAATTATTAATAPRTAAPDVRTGQDIRPRGQECRAGVELLPAGERVTPAVLGLAAAAGHDDMRVVRRPRVEVLVLGAELLHRGLPREGRIRDALGPMLEPWLRACGAEPFVTRRLGDDAELLYEAIATSTADVVVTTGGTAEGPVDHVHGTLRRLKADLLVDGVAVRPGHPMLLAVLPTGAHVVGLPGNPLAAVSGLLTLAEPLVRVLGGAPVPEPPAAVLTADVKGHPTDTRLVPVAMEVGTGHVVTGQAASGYVAVAQAVGEHVAPEHVAPEHAAPEHIAPGRRAVTTPRRPSRTPAPGSPPPYPAARPLHFTGPAMLRGLAVADALAVVPPGGAPAGVPVRVLRLPWTAAPAAAVPAGPTTPAGPA